MESNGAPRLSQLRSYAQKRRWVGLVNQDIATDHQIESSVVHECIGRRFVKSEMLESTGASSLSSYGQDLRIPINPNNRTRRADQFSCQNGNIARATA